MRQNELMRKSPYASKAAHNSAAYDTAFDNKYNIAGFLQGSLQDNIKETAAKEFWNQELSKFDSNRRSRQQEALQNIKDSYTDQLQGLEAKYKNKQDIIKDLTANALAKSQRIGEATARTFFGDKGALGAENLAYQSGLAAQDRAANEGIASLNKIGVLKQLMDSPLLKPQVEEIDGYTDAKDFFMDALINKELSAEDFKKYKKLKGLKKSHSLLDYLNNLGKNEKGRDESSNQDIVGKSK